MAPRTSLSGSSPTQRTRSGGARGPRRRRERRGCRRRKPTSDEMISGSTISDSSGKPVMTLHNLASKFEAIRTASPASRNCTAPGATSGKQDHASGRLKWSQSTSNAQSRVRHFAEHVRDDPPPAAILAGLVGRQRPPCLVDLVVPEMAVEPGLDHRHLEVDPLASGRRRVDLGEPGGRDRLTSPRRRGRYPEFQLPWIL